MRKALLAIATLTVLLFSAAAVTLWLIAGHDVAQLRADAERSKAPVPPALRAAILAAEDPLMLEKPRYSFRALRSLLRWSPRVLGCGPARLERRLVRKTISAHVVMQLFEPEELFRIYAHRVYLGRVGGRNVIGIENGSRTYFEKAAGELTVAEAATLAAMIRAPNYYSPVHRPEKLLARRNAVLARMKRFDAVTEPLRARPAGR